MIDDNVNPTNPPSTPGTSSWTDAYDPFARGVDVIVPRP
jgi:hypothetical protein